MHRINGHRAAGIASGIPGRAEPSARPGRGRCGSIFWLVLSAGLILSPLVPVVAQPPGPAPVLQLPPQVEPRPGVSPIQPPPPEKPTPELSVAPLAGGAPPGADELMVMFWGLEIEGVTVYSRQELEVLYRDLLVTEVPLARIFQIAAEIQAKYHQDGYLLVRVIVPVQNVTFGFYRIQVIEGFVNSIKLEGEVGPVSKRIKSQLQQFVGDRPVHTKKLERYLLLANDIPGINVRGVLRPGVGELGASELVVKVERKRVEGYAVVNNRGSEFTGPWRAIASVRQNSSTSLGETLGLTLGTTLDADEQQFYQLDYQQNIGVEGLTFGATGSYGPSEPGFTLKPLGVETETRFGRASFTYPVIRSRSQSLYVNAGYDATSSEVDVFDIRVSRDDLRVLHGTATYDFVDGFRGVSRVWGGIRQGLDAFGASENGTPGRSRAEGKNDFTSLNAQAWRRQGLGRDWGLLLATKGQYSFDTLLSDEECRLGGEQFGRGYSPSEIAGEDCFAFTAELQYTRQPRKKLLRGYQGYAYYDFGVVWNDDTFADSQDSLASSGIGVRTEVFENFFMDFEVVKPLTRDVATEGDKDLRFFFQALTRF